MGETEHIPRVKVLPGWPTWPACQRWVCTGFFVSLPMLALFLANDYRVYRFAFFGLGIALAMVMIAAVDRYAARTAHLLVGLCVVAGVLLAAAALGWFWPRALGPEFSFYVAFAAFAIGMVTVLWLLVGFVVGILFRGVLTGRVVLQTGALCWRCGYTQQGLPPGGRCPECGTPIGEKPRDTVTEALLRIFGLPRVWALLAISVAGLVAMGVLWARHEFATYRQLRELGSTMELQMMLVDQNSWVYPAKHAGYKPDPRNPDHAWYFVVRRMAPQTTLQVQYRQDLMSGNSYGTSYFSAYAELSPERVAHVLEHGWPEGLLESIREQFDQDVAARKQSQSNSNWMTATEVDVSLYFEPSSSDPTSSEPPEPDPEP